MKILYAIQGTGNGHISRARSIIPHLQQYGTLDLLISGTQADVMLHQPIRYPLHGFSFVFGKNGNVDRWKTFKTMNSLQLYKDIKTLPIEHYDLIINDFEPITAWACKMRGIPSIGLSHQSAFISPKVPRPQHFFPHWGEFVLRTYAPISQALAFHFQAYDDFIHTPIIRQEIRAIEPLNKGHYTVYLPAFDDIKITKLLHQIKEVQWEVFSKHNHQAYRSENVSVQPIHHETFNKSLAQCEGLLTGGGFEGPAEALFLGKKLLCIPMTGQWEQQCNAEALRLMGVPIVTHIDKHFVNRIRQWIQQDPRITIDFKDETAEIVATLIKKYT